MAGKTLLKYRATRMPLSAPNAPASPNANWRTLLVRTPSCAAASRSCAVARNVRPIHEAFKNQVSAAAASKPNAKIRISVVVI